MLLKKTYKVFLHNNIYVSIYNYHQLPTELINIL